MTDSDDRLLALDLMRGAAILGMVLVNAGALLMPQALAIAPDGQTGRLMPTLVWLAQFVLLDGKMRALLALLFGASALLVIDRAEMDGRDGLAEQRRRLLWLLPFGAANYLFVWQGDILLLLAVGGLLALQLVALQPLDLMKWAFGCFALALLANGAVAALPFLTTSAVEQAEWLQRGLLHDLALNRSDYATLLADRARMSAWVTGYHAVTALPETLGFILTGMAMAKGGFFSGQWSTASYRQTALRAYIAGLLPTLALGLWAASTRDPRLQDLIEVALSLPFRIPAAIGHAALLMVVAARCGAAPPRLAQATAAVGRLALSNYLLSGLLLAWLAAGWGAGLYGRLDRVEIAAAALTLALLMLLWSPLWLRLAGRGPAERLWRQLYRA